MNGITGAICLDQSFLIPTSGYSITTFECIPSSRGAALGQSSDAVHSSKTNGTYRYCSHPKYIGLENSPAFREVRSFGLILGVGRLELYFSMTRTEDCF